MRCSEERKLLMKTDVYKFKKSADSIEGVTGIAEKAARYNDLDKKQEIKLSLLCEELVGMLPNLLAYGSGEFWIENEGKSFEIHALVRSDTKLTSFDREELLAVSASGKNAASVGIMNKIRIAAEVMIANYALSAAAATDIENVASPDFYNMGMNTNPVGYTGQWSLQSYRSSAKPDAAAWDELEKSIIANLADDVTVGIIGGKVEIVVKKTF